MRSFLISVLALSASLTSFASACIYSRAEGTEFTYEGSGGPLVWHHLNTTTNKACADGKEQSPINVDTKSNISTSSASLTYPGTGSFNAENRGYTLQFTPKGKNYTAKLGGADYELLQFHFHTPSEHRLNKEHYPLEVHFVHQNPYTKSYAVVGVFFEIDSGSGDKFLAGIYNSLDELKGKDDRTDITCIDMSSISEVVSKNTVYNYKGSLTTPPCTEGINWFVVEKPLTISVMQYQKMKKIMKFNSRVTQNELKYKENIIQDSCRGI